MSRRRRPAISDEERRLFREAVADSRPLPSTNRADTTPPAPSPRRRARTAESETDHRGTVPDAAEHAARLEPDETAPETFRRPGVQHAVMRRLRGGRLAPRDEIDLHGLRREEAHDALHRFLQRDGDGGSFCVRVIHGHGGRDGRQPVLRPLVRQWLADHPRVLAYCPAPRDQGGSGALHVLLARRK